MGRVHWFNVVKSRINMVRRRIIVIRKESTWLEYSTSRKQAGLTEANPPLFEEETTPLKMPADWPSSPAPETTSKPDSDTPPITTSSNGPHTFAKPCAHQYKLLTSLHSKIKEADIETNELHDIMAPLPLFCTTSVGCCSSQV